jgi:hypothetical protein
LNTATGVLVGNTAINYSQDMFTVGEGILAYADQNNNIVAFDAVTGTALPINIAANLKAVAYNSAICIYNKNIYYVSNSGTLRILQRSATSVSYTAYQDVAGQLAGPFTINKQTGTVYAKAYDAAGKQIYFMNNQWTITPIKNYLQGSPVQSSMVYGNGHAYYIGTNGLVSNTFYIAPCIPDVLRTSGPTFTNNGDPLNDPIPLAEIGIPALSVYPNPAKNLVRVNVAVEKTSSIEIKLVSITGNVHLLLHTSVEEGTQDIQVPLQGYAAGTYILQLYVEGTLSASSKLVIY